jgi:hypothetical protein
MGLRWLAIGPRIVAPELKHFCVNQLPFLKVGQFARNPRVTTFRNHWVSSTILSTGAYRKAGTTPTPVETLVTIGILKNDQEETQFRRLVGNDYDLFLNSSQLTAEESDLDSLAAGCTPQEFVGCLPWWRILL